jgi:hypothetical protein
MGRKNSRKFYRNGFHSGEPVTCRSYYPGDQMRNWKKTYMRKAQILEKEEVI